MLTASCHCAYNWLFTECQIHLNKTHRCVLNNGCGSKTFTEVYWRLSSYMVYRFYFYFSLICKNETGKKHYSGKSCQGLDHCETHNWLRPLTLKPKSELVVSRYIQNATHTCTVTPWGGTVISQLYGTSLSTGLTRVLFGSKETGTEMGKHIKLIFCTICWHYHKLEYCFCIPMQLVLLRIVQYRNHMVIQIHIIWQNLCFYHMKP